MVSKGTHSLANETPTLKVGDMAPDFTLPGHLDREVTLSAFRGSKNLVISFYPLDFTPV